ncbi:MAG: hypothetical protein J6B22_07640 [Clostridia bacterium]|nr:hypothetical protein [Clostridia bacterium]
MKGLFKESAKLFGRTILVSFLCFFIVASVLVVSVGFFAEPAGYYVTGTKDGKQENLYTYYTSEGKDTKYETYAQQGYTLEKTDIKLLPESKEKGSLVLAQILCIGILGIFIYPRFWERGYKDRNLAQIGNITGDPLKGLKVGLVSIIPWIVGLLALSGVKDFTVSLLMFAAPIFYPAFSLIADGNIYLSQVGVLTLIGMVACWLILPVFSALGYAFGFKDFSIAEKLTYKKEK